MGLYRDLLFRSSQGSGYGHTVSEGRPLQAAPMTSEDPSLRQRPQQLLI